MGTMQIQKRMAKELEGIARPKLVDQSRAFAYDRDAFILASVLFSRVGLSAYQAAENLRQFGAVLRDLKEGE